jgi:hypothetical protein
MGKVKNLSYISFLFFLKTKMGKKRAYCGQRSTSLRAEQQSSGARALREAESCAKPLAADEWGGLRPTLKISETFYG